MLSPYSLNIPLTEPRRVPVKMIINNLYNATARQKSLLQKHVAQIKLVGVLDQRTMHIREYKDDEYAYYAIYVLEVVLKNPAEMSEVLEILHQAFPEVTLFVVDAGNERYLSAANKRINQNDKERSVIEEIVTARAPQGKTVDYSIGTLPGENLKEYFEEIIKKIYRIKVLNATGTYPSADVDYKQIMKKYDQYRAELNQLTEAYKQVTMKAEKLDIDDKIYDKQQQIQTLLESLKGSN